MKIEEALRLAKKRLEGVAQRPLFEAQILLSHLLKKDRIYLHAHGDETLEAKTLDTFFAAVERRAAFEPIEYITGRVSFYGEEFFIEPGVLIPRPETELLIDEVAKELKGDERVAEIGVGSGVISIILKKRFPHLSITATDINEKALELATKNAKKHGVDIEFVHTSLLDGLQDRFDVILSNPPYIKRGEKLEPNVIEYEPHEALFGGEEGDEMLRSIIDLFFRSNAKILACEMGYDQREKIESHLERYQIKARFYKDLAGLDRGFVVRKDKK
jgi:release factor glutamine methyltransferase